MMDFEQALVYELQAISGLSGKVFPQGAKEDSKPPFVVYFSTEGEQIMTLSGATDMTELTCDVHVIAESYEEMKTLAKAVYSKIKSFFQRRIGIDGVYIKSIAIAEPVEDFDDDLNYHKSSFDIRVRF